MKDRIQQKGEELLRSWVNDWCKFAREALGVSLDADQEAILRSVQFNPRTSVTSGTSRGKDFVTAVSSLCFLYLTPKWNKKGELIENTKVALTAPTDRQVKNIMVPEFRRLLRNARSRGVDLPGRVVAYDIRTDYNEWFLTGFKADDDNLESWSGFHAVNTMFAVTEASGLAETVYEAIEGNMQGNSRMLIVFNPNRVVGYAAQSQKSSRWKSFRLDDLTAPNVVEKRKVIPGQVDYDWVKDKIEYWCTRITPQEFNEGEGDFVFEGQTYRPNDLFRIKVRGMFPKESSDTLIPYHWLELAVNRYKELDKTKPVTGRRILGVDVAGMGRDNSVICERVGDIVEKFDTHHSGGKADHMQVAGKVSVRLKDKKDVYASIDTIGEGAGVYSRLVELGYDNAVYSCKYSEGAANLKDITLQYEFQNMRAYLFWAVRDWLNPANNSNACLPDIPELIQEATEIKYIFQSNGKIIIEPKEKIVERLGRSPDRFDALANTFYPIKDKGEVDYSSIIAAFG